jgi:filamentous hemagglutinin
MPATPLRNAHLAAVDPRKIVDYALNPDNPVGRHKARVFAAALGFDRSNGHLLVDAIRRGVMTSPAEPAMVDAYGARYRVDLPLTGPRGRAVVRTAWIYRTGSDVPELVTLHVV